MPLTLLIGTDPEVLARITGLLSPSSTVEQADSQEAAQAAISASHPDLLIVHGAEGLDALALIGWIRAHKVVTQVLLIAPALTKPLVLALMRLKVDDYLLATFTDDELVDAACKALAKRVVAEPAADAPTPGAAADPPAATEAEAVGSAPVVPVRAVLIGLTGEPARAIGERLQERGIKAYAGNNGVFQLIRKDPWFVMVIARLSGMSPGDIDKLKKLMFDKPTLKVILLAAEPLHREVEPLRELGIRRLLPDPTDAAEIARLAGEELADHHFDPKVVEFLRTSVPRVLADAPIKVHPALVQMRVSAQVLARTTALVEVAGADLVGRLTVSGDPTVMSRLARHWLGEEPRTRDAMWDAVGELANRLAGEIRQHYYARGLASHQAPPLVLEGTDTEIRQHSKTPGLVFSFAVERGDKEVHVEWFVSHKSTREFEQAPSSVAEEDINFF